MLTLKFCSLFWIAKIQSFLHVERKSAHLPMSSNLPPLPPFETPNSKVFLGAPDIIYSTETDIKKQIKQNKKSKINLDGNEKLTVDAFMLHDFAGQPEIWHEWDIIHTGLNENKFSCPEGFSFDSLNRTCLHITFSHPIEQCPQGAFREAKSGNCKHFDSVAPERTCPAGFTYFVKGCIRITTKNPYLSCPAGYILYENSCWSNVKANPIKTCPQNFVLGDIPSVYVNYDFNNSMKNINLAKSYTFDNASNKEDKLSTKNSNVTEYLDNNNDDVTSNNKTNLLNNNDKINEEGVNKHEVNISKANVQEKGSLDINDNEIIENEADNYEDDELELDRPISNIYEISHMQENNFSADNLQKYNDVESSYKVANVAVNSFDDELLQNRDRLNDSINVTDQLISDQENSNLIYNNVIQWYGLDEDHANEGYDVDEIIIERIMSDNTTIKNNENRYLTELSQGCLKETILPPLYKCEKEFQLDFLYTNKIVGKYEYMSNDTIKENKIHKEPIIIELNHNNNDNYEVVTTMPQCTKEIYLNYSLVCPSDYVYIDPEEFDKYRNKILEEDIINNKFTGICMKEVDVIGQLDCIKKYKLVHIALPLDNTTHIKNWTCEKVESNKSKTYSLPIALFHNNNVCNNKNIQDHDLIIKQNKNAFLVCKYSVVTSPVAYCNKGGTLYCSNITGDSNLELQTQFAAANQFEHINSTTHRIAWNNFKVNDCILNNGDLECIHTSAIDSPELICPPNSVLINKLFEDINNKNIIATSKVCSLTEVAPIDIVCPLNINFIKDNYCDVIERQAPAIVCPEGYTKASSNKYKAYPNVNNIFNKISFKTPTIILNNEPNICELVEYADYIINCPIGYRRNKPWNHANSCVAEKYVTPTYICPPGFLNVDNRILLPNDTSACLKTIEVAPSIISYPVDSKYNDFDHPHNAHEIATVCDSTSSGYLSCGNEKKYHGSGNYEFQYRKSYKILKHKKDSQEAASIKRSSVHVT